MAVRRVTWCGQPEGHPPHNDGTWSGPYCPGEFCPIPGCWSSPTHLGNHGVFDLRNDPFAGWGVPRRTLAKGSYE